MSKFGKKKEVQVKAALFFCFVARSQGQFKLWSGFCEAAEFVLTDPENHMLISKQDPH